jgi:hypothetical protein
MKAIMGWEAAGTTQLVEEPTLRALLQLHKS